MRSDGFTDFLLNEAKALYERTQNNKQPIQSKIFNHLAWYIHKLNPKATKEFLKEYYNVIQQIFEDAPSDIKDDVENKGIDDYTPYEKARCLTFMRENMIAKNHAQIFAGGKHLKYAGMMPGILEEFLLANLQNIPIFLFAGFGGISRTIYLSIKDKRIDEKLTEQWQRRNNGSNYQQLLGIAENKGKKADYTAVKELLETVTIEDLADKSGLSKENYIKMAETPFIDIALYYLLQGLENKFKKNTLE